MELVQIYREWNREWGDDSMKSLGFSLALLLPLAAQTVRAEGLLLIAPPPPETEQPLPTLQPGRPCPALPKPFVLI